MFDIQDRIVRDIAGRLAGKLNLLEQQRITAKPPGNMEAYDLVLRARELVGRFERVSNREAASKSAYAAAYKAARSRAEAYAGAADLKVSRVLAISPGAFSIASQTSTAPATEARSGRTPSPTSISNPP